jgi:hypothetical protein
MGAADGATGPRSYESARVVTTAAQGAPVAVTPALPLRGQHARVQAISALTRFVPDTRRGAG